MELQDLKNLIRKNILGRLMVIRTGFQDTNHKFSLVQTTFIRLLAKTTNNYQQARQAFLGQRRGDGFYYFVIVNELENLLTDLKRLNDSFGQIDKMKVVNWKDISFIEGIKDYIETKEIKDVRGFIQHLVRDIEKDRVSGAIAPHFSEDAEFIEYNNKKIEVKKITSLLEKYYSVAEEVLEII